MSSRRLSLLLVCLLALACAPAARAQDAAPSWPDGPGYAQDPGACDPDAADCPADPAGDPADQPADPPAEPPAPPVPAPPVAPPTPPAPHRPAGPTLPPAPIPDAVHLRADGTVWASPKVPRVVRRVIAAANRIAKLPYRYGGGHGSFRDTAYDCSGSVSFALHGGDLLALTLDSTGLERWGAAGTGRWITVYANSGHAWMVVAGLRFDTGGQDGSGSRWQAWPRPKSGFVVRHPAGL